MRHRDNAVSEGDLYGIQDHEEPVTTVIDEPTESTGIALVIERLAVNPNVDVEKLEKIIELQERILRHRAKAAFDAAFSKMQPEIPVIDERGRIEVRGQLRSTYAPIEDIHDVIKPILAKYGFAIRHRTEWPADKPGTIRIVGILSCGGHSEDTAFEAKADASEYRSDIQSQGSTVSYGRRYTTLDLLNISTRKQDNDGQASQKTADIPAPAGFEEWWKGFEALADKGTAILTEGWNRAKPEYRNHLMKTNKNGWTELKQKAGAVK